MVKQLSVLALCATLVMAAAVPALAQGRQTGTLRGTARDQQGLVVPGVSITVESTALQGVRSTQTGLTGRFDLPGLPPGAYTVTFTIDGFATVRHVASLPLGGTVEVNATLEPAAVRETVQVVEVVPSPLAATEFSYNMTSEGVNALPLGRDIVRIAELAPGVTTNTPSENQITISGAFGYDNAFLINGVDVNDNIFGTPNDLFIEDAIEETQVLSSGISSEYGRFTGGVVNAVTKSGGNMFSGSFRANVYRPDWTSTTPFERENGIERSGSLADNSTYETTVGGPIVQDRLWFFYANRVQQENLNQTLDVTGADYAHKLDNKRNLIKLTGALSPGHRLEGSYLSNSTAQTQPSFGFSIDPNTVIDRTVPNDLFVATYRGALSSAVFAEFQVSQRRFRFRNNGGVETGILESPFLTLTQRFGHYNAPYFDANDPQERNNRQVTGNATYFLPTSNFGTHSIKGGFEHFQSTLVGGNSQTATGFVFSADYEVDGTGSPVLDADGRLSPIFTPFANLIQDWRPVRGAELDIRTLSFYLNDSWAFGDHWSFNLGVRAEQVDSEATGQILGLDTSTVVPRLAAAFDPQGDGQLTFHATYGHYAGRYSEAQFNQNTNVGRPNALFGIYTGPAGQGRDFAPGFDPANYATVAAFFPTDNVFYQDQLSAPLTREFTLSAGKAMGSRGYAKATYIHRTMSDFVEDFFTLDGGTTTIVEDGQTFGTFVNQWFQNTDALERAYDAMQFHGHYRVTDRFLLDGSYTVQINNDGNFEGETTNRPAIPSPAFDWPEITPAHRYFPTGRLDEFQRHKVRVWGIYNLGLGGAGDLDIGGLWRYNSGLTYSIQAANQGVTPTQQGIINALGYASGPAPRTLFFADGRGSGSFAGYGLFDLSFQYSIPVWQSLRPWIKAEVYNLFNNDTRVTWDTSVVPNFDGTLDELGLPTTYIEAPSFGQATSVNDYPQFIPGRDGLRTIMLSMGFRF